MTFIGQDATVILLSGFFELTAGEQERRTGRSQQEDLGGVRT